MRVERFTAEHPGRLDAVLARTFPDASRSYWKTRIAAGSVLVDGAVKKADLELKGGETVEVRWPESGGVPDLERRVLLEDADLLALDKPPGLIVHPLGVSWLKRPQVLLAEKEPTLAAWLFQARGLGALPRVGIVHRLDRGTSGVIVAAKTLEAQQSLLEQFRERQVEKRYRAVVLGRIARRTLRVDVPIGRPVRSRRVKADPLGKEASTEVTVLGTSPGFSLVEARPLTGRTHQIRVHLATSGHPVAGDVEWVGAEDLEKLKAAGLTPPRLMLHAWRLTFRHPRTGLLVRVEAKLPSDLREYWERARASGKT